MLYVLTYCGSQRGARSLEDDRISFFAPLLNPGFFRQLDLLLFAVVLPLKPRPLPPLRLCVDRSAARLGSATPVCADRGGSSVHTLPSYVATRTVPLLGEPSPLARTAGSELGDLLGADDECSAAPAASLSCPWLRTCSAAEKSAPSPTLHYDKSRQAGRQAGS